MPDDDRRLVYSTDGTLPLPPARRAKRPAASPAPPADGIVRVGCERRRAGSVTLVYGLAAGETAAIAAELRRRCATGGTAKDGVVTLQGDHRDAILAYFAARKRQAKRMGG
ncbi:MAG: stress response translation initiation inhibitor YciH [Candidatus Eremiobacteraeota bacterium]|nr:stress response translation initiation inhibitor YciH [Candidatus Eremiobacteraeota bacterium]MBC5801576.1 stress response translation initiation inhibitor YciH [Candidatus Eremiobacteraeota bacterium]MBC5821697.1 stress response translation initiation inhibitor YciH [Candidatus Eremiobacteraeota bacterium]